MSSAPGHLFLLGASHHTAPLAVRERLALSPEKLATFCERLQQLENVHEFTVLNTCNRVEIYGAGRTAQSMDAVAEIFCQLQQVTPAEFNSASFRLGDLATIEHLFRVASGLDSQMLGETEILGQVKAAYAQAQAKDSVGPVLNRVFQKTFQAAKYVRTHTAIGEGQTSVASVAVDLALKIFGPLEHTRVLVIGAGEIGEKTLRAFKSRGTDRITLTSRTLAKAQDMAAEFGGQAAPFEELPALLANADITVCSTAAPSYIVPATLASHAMKHRPGRPLFFIDLALPRDVDPEVVRQSNVFLYNLDDLAKIAEENRVLREAELVRCHTLISERAQALWKQLGGHLQSSPATPSSTPKPA